MKPGQDFSTPNWLAAYPNEGQQDYFGGRWYRQPLRRFLARGAAANQFRKAKTLIYLGAVSFAFRLHYSLDSHASLNDEARSNWSRWFKNANFLFVVNCYAHHQTAPDAGFTGANQAYDLFFKDFYSGDVDVFDCRSAYDVFYPVSRPWGYLTQFWVAPLSYFRIILSIQECYFGEYAEACFSLMSEFPGWQTFLKVIDQGRLSRAALDEIQPELEVMNITDEERSLAQKIIFDLDEVTGEENDHYKRSFRIIKSFLDDGLEGQEVRSAEQLGAAFTYQMLKNSPVSDVAEYYWRILISSVAFEAGITQVYTLLGSIADFDVVEVEKLDHRLEEELALWCADNGIEDGVLKEVSESWSGRFLESFSAFQNKSAQLTERSGTATWIDGLLIGLLIANVRLPEGLTGSDEYAALTDDYHHFIPQVFFRAEIDLNIRFADFLKVTVIRLIEEQFEFSIERLGMGQKPKFILRKDEVTGNYLFDIDNRSFSENRGVIEMTDACLTLWRSAGIIQ